jgi:hypothetical protein
MFVRLQSLSLFLFYTFPAKYAAPPWDIWRMIGDLASRAASREATTVEDEVQFYKKFSQDVSMEFADRVKNLRWLGWQSCAPERS